MRVVFMGTPSFAVPSLLAIHENFELVGVVTAMDKPAGRGYKLQSSAVKQAAEALKVPILQPEKLKSPDFINALQALHADVFVVVAFRMLPEIVWQMPKKGTINLHASLLPQYRGAAPINWAIINGENQTGLTTFLIEKEIDTGKVLLQKQMSIGAEENAGHLHDRMMQEGANLLLETLKGLSDNSLVGTVQSAHENILLKPAPKLHKDNCKLDFFNQDVFYLHNQVRGLSPYPGAWTFLQKNNDVPKQLKIFSATYKEEPSVAGAIYSDNEHFLGFGAKHGVLYVQELQLEGKKICKCGEFLRGFQIKDTKLLP